MRALIVDDERLARNELRRLLSSHPEVTIAGEARNADEALAQVRRLAPELLFLDVQMPGRSGFELLEQLDDVPPVIFTTAYDKDYLLKPIVPARLSAALAKVRKRLAEAGSSPPAPQSLHQVFVKDGDRCWFVRVADIALLAAVLWQGAAPRSQVSQHARATSRPGALLPREPAAHCKSPLDRIGRT